MIDPECPVCGSPDGEPIVIGTTFTPILGPKTSFSCAGIKCSCCHEERTDPFDAEERYRAAERRSIAVGVQEALDTLNEQGYSDVSVERVLRLPIGKTVREWRAGRLTPEAAALVRIIVDDPLILYRLDP